MGKTALRVASKVANYLDIAQANMKAFSQDPVVMVFSPNLSGTDSLTHTLGITTHSTHWIGRPSRRRYLRERKLMEGKPLAPTSLAMFFHCLYPDFHKLNKKLLICTSVREPIARQLSAFARIRYETQRDFIVNAPVEEIHNVFKQTCKKDKGTSTDWFDKSFYTETGIDVYQHSFNKTAGFGIAKGKDDKFGFIIKAEAARDPHKNENILSALRGFTGLPCPAFITETNYNASAASAEYASRYREIVDTFVADEEYLDYVYNSKHMRHFYTDAEIVAFRDKWLHKTTELSDIA